jgi:FlaA1/EpsC-like NDP-sugar epimerase
MDYFILSSLILIPSLIALRFLYILFAKTELLEELSFSASFEEHRETAQSPEPMSADRVLSVFQRDQARGQYHNIFKDRIVLVTGAGGTIGTEICRQVARCGPRKLILFESGEFPLYCVDREVQSIVKSDVLVEAVLGSVSDEHKVETVLINDTPDFVFHTASYKHVPLAEKNEIEVIKNNVFGSQLIAKLAKRHGVGCFVNVSTDRAARPTNIVGATKRLAEMLIQDIASRSEKTKFITVRFGNVLGTQGSFLPVFQRQIAAGGPVSVTHPELSRHFMTLGEAGDLILASAYLGENESVCVFDMGQPLKVIEIAKVMIKLSGNTVRDEDNPQGDIEIQITGLRPGEKLHEESIIEEPLRRTSHPKILLARASAPSEIEMAQLFRDLLLAVKNDDSDFARKLIVRWVEGHGSTYSGTEDTLGVRDITA